MPRRLVRMAAAQLRLRPPARWPQPDRVVAEQAERRAARGGRVPFLAARSGKPLFIAGLGISQIASWGTLYYSFPLIAERMGQDLGLSKPEIYGAATIGLVILPHLS